MKFYKKENLSYYILIILLFAFDQLTKQFMYLISSRNVGYSIKIFKDYLRLTYVENHGGIFGIFQGYILVFTIVSTLLIAYVYHSELRYFSTYPPIKKLATSFIIAGAMGNMFDRFLRGYVIDMIDLRAIWQYIFNVADMYIHIGLYILIISYLIKRRKK